MVGDVEVAVIRIKGDKITLGVTGPREIRVDRTEVLQARRDKELPEQ